MRRLIVIVIVTTLLAGCGPSPQDVEATLQAGISLTETARPTATVTPRPTATPKPTSTPRPTPAPLGVAVKHNGLEITVLAAYDRQNLHLGDISGRHYVYYVAPKGAMMLDVAILVHNPDASKSAFSTWSSLVVKEENGDRWYPLWAKVKSVPVGTKEDPFAMGLASDDLDPSAMVEFKDDTYIRMIYLVSDNPTQLFTFNLENSPSIVFNAAKAP